MDFGALSPEVNSAKIYAGPGSGPMLAASAAWDGVATELYSAAGAYRSALAGLISGPWLGSSSVSMLAAAAPFAAWISMVAALAEQTANQARAAAAAFQIAFAMTVPPSLVAANRCLLTVLVATNFFGQNTPAIATTEIQYGEMWAQDAVAMNGYAVSSASATTLTPFTSPPQSTGSGGQAAQAGAVAQAIGMSAATNTQTALSQLTTAVPAALQALASPLQPGSAATLAASGLAGILQSLDLTSPLSLLGLFEPASAGLASSELATAAGAWGSASDADAQILESHAELAGTHDLIASTLGQITSVEGQIMDRLGRLAPATTGSGVSAGLGQATSVGALSVPPGWAVAAPPMRLATTALPLAGLRVGPEVYVGNTGNVFSELALASMAGRALSGTARPGGRERPGATTGDWAARPQLLPGGAVPGIAAELRALAELRDSGILTDEEFSEQKRRLLA